MSHPPSNAAPPAPLVPLLSAVEWRGLRPMASAPGQIQPARGGMAERHVGRRIARGCDERRDCAPPTDPDPGVVTPVCERRSANRSATRGRGLVGAQALERHQIRTACSPMARRRSCLQRRSSPPNSKSPSQMKVSHLSTVVPTASHAVRVQVLQAGAIRAGARGGRGTGFEA